MSSAGKGIVLGSCNVFAVALGLGILESSGSPRVAASMSLLVALVGAMPGVVAGAVIGHVAGRITALRRVALVSLALFAIVVLGILTEPRFIWLASIPTVGAALLLERWTRADLPGAQPPAGGLMPATTKGALVGFANVVATAIVIGLIVAVDPPISHGDAETLGFGFSRYLSGSAIGLQITLLVTFAGLLPGVVVGVGLGRLADQLRTSHTIVRLAILGALAVLAVSCLGLLTTQRPFIVPAFLPALFASAALERWTRPALPRAIALR